MTKLPAGFADRPFAHRGLHGVAGPENSPAAFRAAIARGYGIELDVQASADNRDALPIAGDGGDLVRRPYVRNSHARMRARP